MARFVSILFTPGIRPPMFEKAKSAPADVVCLDLEDSVASNDKLKARTLVAGAIAEMAAAVKTLIIRVNGLETGLLEEDLAAVVQPGVAGISLPKANSPAVVQQVDHYLTLLERLRGLPPRSIAILPWIETAAAVLHCEAIVSASPRVLAASFGAEDFTSDLGIPRTRDNPQLAAARARVALACKAAGVIPLDTPDPEYRDLDWLAADTRVSRDLGFEGRYCIHPAQLAIVNAGYAPTEDEIAQAQRIIEAYEEAERRGLGAIGLDGMMIDAPIVARARRLLARAGR
ncbi:MAG: CoA ester lyase [Chloroflexota bacterium]|nr:CoA ester lyase [Dehalococcoidia bacterium]MDW8253004.1 CoA ester lyase [Chloroflexota bacterium]